MTLPPAATPDVPAEPKVTAQLAGGVLELVLDYPRRRNALAAALKADLIHHLRQGMADRDCRVIVISGAGGHFCAGGDISRMKGVSAIEGRGRMAGSHELIGLLVHGDKPVIAAVEGHAAGAGLSLAAACDVVVASAAAVFTCSFNRIGLVPDLGAAWTLPRRMGLGRAKLLMLSGRPMDATAAHAQGLADLVCDAGTALDTARALAADMATVAPWSNAMAKSLLARSGGSLEELLRAEADVQGLLYGTDDSLEGRTAFMEKRPPRFGGT